jgi:hypothetical protein
MEWFGIGDRSEGGMDGLGTRLRSRVGGRLSWEQAQGSSAVNSESYIAE